MQIVLALCVFAAYFSVFCEWFLFATTPSFLSDLPLWRQLVVAVTAPFFYIAVQFVLCFVLWQATRWLPAGPWRVRLVAAVPAALFTAFLLLEIDVFAYTVLGATVLEARGWQRVLCLSAALAMAVIVMREALRAVDLFVVGGRGGLLLRSAVVLFCLSLAGAAAGLAGAGATLFSRPADAAAGSPDVILIGVDGLEARDMRLYGGVGGEMPNLEAFAKDALVFQNVFANGNVTAASLPSILTGRTPVALNKLSSQQILQGEDRFRHLPGMFRRAGYHSVQVGMKYYADANAWNMRDAFDVVNETVSPDRVIPRAADGMFRIWNEEMYLCDLSLARISTRVRALFGVAPVEEPLLTDGFVRQAELDRRRVDGFVAPLSQGRKPLFIHAHLMGTHPTLTDLDQVRTMPVRVREADERIGEMLDALRRTGRFERAIIVIYSDHSSGWGVDRRIPLIIRFPTPVSGVDLATNAQNVDIAPTILDYVNLPVPAAVEGVSLLGSRDRRRPIFAEAYDEGERRIDVLRVTVCDESFALKAAGGDLSHQAVAGHTSPCPDEGRPDASAARRLIADFLARNKFVL